MRIDFYLLNSSDRQATTLFACRLLEKAFLLNHRIFVYCNTEAEAHEIDEKLWTYKDDSFIPHNLQGEGPEPPPAIQIGYDHEPRGFNDILLNLSMNIPTFHSKFRRIIEIVSADDNELANSRHKYQNYRKYGYIINTHKSK